MLIATRLGSSFRQRVLNRTPWSKILAQLAAARPHPGSDARGSEDRYSWVSAARLFVKQWLG